MAVGVVDWPLAYDTPKNLIETKNNEDTLLTAAIGPNDTTIPALDTSTFAQSGVISLGIEIVWYDNKTPTSFLLCQRGMEGKARESHAGGTLIEGRVTARHHNVLSEAILKIEQRVGLGTDPLATQDWVSDLVATIPAGVTSFNGRSGAVEPMSGDYALTEITGLSPALAALVSADAALDARLDALELSPGGVTSFNGRTGAVVPLSADYAAHYLSLAGGTVTGPIYSTAPQYQRALSVGLAHLRAHDSFWYANPVGGIGEQMTLSENWFNSSASSISSVIPQFGSWAMFWRMMDAANGAYDGWRMAYRQPNASDAALYDVLSYGRTSNWEFRVWDGVTLDGFNLPLPTPLAFKSYVDQQIAAVGGGFPGYAANYAWTGAHSFSQVVTGAQGFYRPNDAPATYDTRIFIGKDVTSSLFPGIWFAQSPATATTDNYSFLYSLGELSTIFNSPVGGSIQFRLGNAHTNQITYKAGNLMIGWASTDVPSYKFQVNGISYFSGMVSASAPMKFFGQGVIGPVDFSGGVMAGLFNNVTGNRQMFFSAADFPGQVTKAGLRMVFLDGLVPILDSALGTGPRDWFHLGSDTCGVVVGARAVTLGYAGVGQLPQTAAANESMLILARQSTNTFERVKFAANGALYVGLTEPSGGGGTYTATAPITLTGTAFGLDTTAPYFWIGSHTFTAPMVLTAVAYTSGEFPLLVQSVNTAGNSFGTGIAVKVGGSTNPALVTFINAFNVVDAHFGYTPSASNPFSWTGNNQSSKNIVLGSLNGDCTLGAKAASKITRIYAGGRTNPAMEVRLGSAYVFDGNGTDDGTSSLERVATRRWTGLATSAYALDFVTDCSLGDRLFRITLTGNLNLKPPTGMRDGQHVTWEFIEDATGGYTVTLDPVFVLGQGMSFATDTRPNATSFLVAIYRQALAKWLVVGLARGYV